MCVLNVNETQNQNSFTQLKSSLDRVTIKTMHSTPPSFLNAQGVQ